MPWLVLKIQHNILSIWPAHAVWSQFDRSYFYGSDNFPRFQIMIIVEKNCSSELCIIYLVIQLSVLAYLEILKFCYLRDKQMHRIMIVLKAFLNLWILNLF